MTNTQANSDMNSFLNRQRLDKLGDVVGRLLLLCNGDNPSNIISIPGSAGQVPVGYREPELATHQDAIISELFRLNFTHPTTQATVYQQLLGLNDRTSRRLKQAGSVALSVLT